MRYKNIIFDADGTLLETLSDIVSAVNKTLKELNYNNVIDHEGGKALLGRGADYLISEVLKEFNPTPEDLSNFKKVYLPHYKYCQEFTTKPFVNMANILQELKELGYDLFVLTNKPDHLMEILINKYFKGLFSGFIGANDDLPKKPSKELSEHFLATFNLNKDECLYVGDSEVDVILGENISMDVALCLYGYGDYAKINRNRYKYEINCPEDLLKVLKE